MSLKKQAEKIEAASLEYYYRLRSTKKRIGKRKEKKGLRYMPINVRQRKLILKTVCFNWGLDKYSWRNY